MSAREGGKRHAGLYLSSWFPIHGFCFGASSPVLVCQVASFLAFSPRFSPAPHQFAPSRPWQTHTMGGLVQRAAQHIFQQEITRGGRPYLPCLHDLRCLSLGSAVSGRLFSAVFQSTFFPFGVNDSAVFRSMFPFRVNDRGFLSWWLQRSHVAGIGAHRDAHGLRDRWQGAGVKRGSRE